MSTTIRSRTRRDGFRLPPGERLRAVSGSRHAPTLLPDEPSSVLRRLVPARRPRRTAGARRAHPGLHVQPPGPVSFYDRDHGARDGSPAAAVDRRPSRAGRAIDLEGGPIRVLCFPRVFGYGFNPICVWFCHGPSGELRAILYEVSNTFGEWHDYLVRSDPRTSIGNERGASVRTVFDKELLRLPVHRHGRHVRLHDPRARRAGLGGGAGIRRRAAGCWSPPSARGACPSPAAPC